ncbi:response regulator [Adhaeribacter rhizoryzae]|uniref:Response regulator n=1 Tax=Adhaeribacter rhizoryzae TaxID=2607907 RepID=A0A5M6DAC4_9BACT|nr:response regulator [Adhaeribacter rhizoryzae]KAA5543476.1 response regulator [Adhaeribacter rhizoryzae]
MKIFIIDDDEISIFLTERSLQLGGFKAEITTFLEADAALEVLKNAPEEELPNFIFLDLNMPEVDGWEFLAAFEQLDQERSLNKCAIYILTSSLNISDIDRANEHELIKGFIHKPVNLEDMEAILHLNY